MPFGVLKNIESVCIDYIKSFICNFNGIVSWISENRLKVS
jgi:hypothetical protein